MPGVRQTQGRSPIDDASYQFISVVIGQRLVKAMKFGLGLAISVAKLGYAFFGSAAFCRDDRAYSDGLSFAEIELKRMMNW